MTSTLSVKKSGAWSAPAGDGVIHVKNGGAWASPAHIYCKRGGTWVDTSYLGYPNPPGDPAVYAWDYSNVQAYWGYAAAGGAAISYYEVQLLHADGSIWAAENSTDNISPQWGIGSDQRAQIRVRSVAANGLASGWSNMLRVGTGHDVSYNYGYVARTRSWVSNHVSGARNRDEWFAVSIPSSVNFTGMHWRNLRMPGSSIVTPFGSRTVNWIVASQDFGPVNNNTGQINSGDNRDYGFNNNGQDAAWGIIPRGAGWSTTSQLNVMLVVDDLWCDGTETYNNYEIVSTNPAQGNYYW